MSKSIAQLFNQLIADPWRSTVGFSPGVEQANERLFRPTVSESESIAIINDWLKQHQPCLFGVIAARLGLISFCILNEDDLSQSDEFISNKIQYARTEWTSAGFAGHKSAFILLAISSRITNSLPDENTKAFARKLCSLYLQQEIKTDRIYLDNIFLEHRGRERTATWVWPTGVNYFCAQGDKRWWQDHRIPGGLAFSVNSVGHMVKSEVLSKGLHELDDLLGLSQQDSVQSKVDSLDKALQLAMSTIARASIAPSGKATELLPRVSDEPPVCPESLPSALSNKDCREYRGYYHTDHTLPSGYFLPDINRPEGLKVHTLDFTYLFDQRLDNPDFSVLGQGRRLRSTTKNASEKSLLEKIEKRHRQTPQLISIKSASRLIEALARFPHSSR